MESESARSNPEADASLASVPQPYLVAKGLAVTGPEGPVYSGLSLSACRGELVVLQGDAGTGRTAALLTLAGRFVPSQGQLSVGGQRRPARIRRLVGVAQAAPAVAAEQYHTVAQLITETTLVSSAKRSDVLARLATIAPGVDKRTGFGHLEAVDRVLVMLALSAAARPSVIAIDNVDDGVHDPERVWAALRALADDTLVLATAVRADARADQCVHLEGT